MGRGGGVVGLQDADGGWVRAGLLRKYGRWGGGAKLRFDRRGVAPKCSGVRDVTRLGCCAVVDGAFMGSRGWDSGQFWINRPRGEGDGGHL